MPDLVSILIPAYNAEKWIGYTIRSAISQTWPRKEIIIVDDGSSDKTLAIAKQFESGFLKVISQENRGAAAARNKALGYAQGDYIQWLDADDLLASNKISEQMKVIAIDQTPLTLYSSPHGVFYSRPEKAIFVPNSLWQDLIPVKWLIHKFSENLWMCPAGWLISRRMAEKGGPWDERLSLNDDGEYFCRIVSLSDGIKFVREARCYYRRSGYNQLSMSTSESSAESLLLSTKLCIRYLRSVEDSERTKRASLILLHSCLPRFYSHKTELLEEINTIAFELGGELTPPQLSWKFNQLSRLIGRKAADRVMSVGRKLKLLTAIKWDEIVYRITKSSVKFHCD